MGLLVLLVGLVTFLIGVHGDPRRMRNAVSLLVTVVAALGGAASLIVAGLRPSDFAVAVAVFAVSTAGLAMLLVLGLASIANGVVMLRSEGVQFAHALSLLFGVACIGTALTAGTIRALEPWHDNVTESVAVAVSVALLPVSYLAFGFTAYVLYSVGYLAWARRCGERVGAVIVLGSGLRGESVPPLLAARLDCGRAALDRVGMAGACLVVSGGKGADEKVSEAVAMADYLAAAGLDRSRIVLEDRSATTEENLRYSHALLAERGIDPPAAVVSSNFHAFRAALHMREVGLPGYALGAHTAAYYWPSATIREFVAICLQHRTGNGIALAILSVPLVGLLIRGC